MNTSNQNFILKQVYQLADDFFALEPWKLFDEVDIFGVLSPDSGKEYFISIMGSDDISYSLAAYEGREALYQFWNMHMMGDSMPPFYLMTIPYLMLSLENPDFIDTDKVSQLKKQGVKTRQNKLPHLVKMTPGFYPKDLKNEELKDMLHILNQSIHVVKESAKQNKANIHSEQDHDQDYLFRVVEDEKTKTNWTSKKIRVSPPTLKMAFTYDRGILDAFMKAPNYKNTIEVDLQFLTRPVKDDDETVYFPALLLAVDTKEQNILFMEMLQPFPDYKHMLSTIPNVFMRKSLELEKKITAIKFRNPDLEPALRFLNKLTGMRTIFDEKLEGVENVSHFLQQQLFDEEGK